MKTIVTTLVLGATLAVPLSASAQVSAQGTLNNFSYSLVDLLPNDGIAPTLSIVKPLYPEHPGTRAVGDISETGLRQTRESSEDRSRVLYSRNLDAGLSVPQGSVVSTVGGTNFQTLALSTAASTKNGAGYERRAVASNYVMIEEFVLAPGTQVRFLADASGSVSKSQPNTSSLKESSTFTASMSFPEFSANGYPDFVSEFSLRAPSWSADPNSPYSESASERLSIMFQNTAKTSVNLKVLLTLWSEANSLDTSPVASPVPEPATYGMLIAGLALVAGVARRKRPA
ncbi:PEP-CTERM sorting domain-containing protein [Massilia genomosp. 1]|uniref:PEP-CTERM sorting domain-containing protein n=1 Tax=Massilia genomosp. 1 TaxID=2609280 RepID=A0ABX0MZC6_9BURK|nr:PEP-CTERM sorting domain-containing protein [Massilia genomosp. 1]NHZ65773.1 PEP-CTERM sorting domain-containing protein [Massilia genomosp. 1]